MSSAGYSASPAHWGRCVAIHFGMATEWAGLVSSHAKPVEWPEFPMAFKTLRFSCHGSIFVNVWGDDVLCSSERLPRWSRGLRMSRLRSLLGFGRLFIAAGDPNMNWDLL
ncbi:hypothetical protein TNCV_1539011 [Trichonephila clavipes]|nr:hypothetical protein TNCV_1539011 [Trichonephila clavipes]